MPSLRYLKTATDRIAEDVPLSLVRLLCSEFPDWSDLTQADEEDFPGDWDPNVMYFVNNTEPVLSRGHTYIPWMFELVPPGQGSGGSAASLRFENLDRRIADAIKLLPGDAQIYVEGEAVLYETPEIIEESFEGFRLSSITLQELSIDAQIGPSDDSAEPFCSFRYLPGLTPGVFPQ